MKIILILTSFFLISITNAFGQVKLDSSATWTIASIGWGSYWSNETYMIVGDTSINSIDYKNIYQTKDSIFDPINSTYFCSIRESGQKWYIVSEIDSIEHILYDFNIQIGDTVTSYNLYLQEYLEQIVSNVDSIELNGNKYKNIELRALTRSFVENWIEGIGSTNGFYVPAHHVYDAGFQLLCFHRNDSLIYLNSPDGTCGYIKVGKENLLLDSEIKISPNPVTNILNIESNNDQRITIYDSTGKKVLSSNNKQIDISIFKRGVYEVKIFDNNNKYITTKKILKR